MDYNWKVIATGPGHGTQLESDPSADCESWSSSQIIEAGPSGYSDMAQADDGVVLCVYEDGMFERMTDTRAISIARFDLLWLKGEE